MSENAQPTLTEYKVFIDEIFRRLDKIEEPLAAFKANTDQPDAWLYCDCSWLQVRKICEYLAAAIVFAHHLETKAIGDLSKWRPKDLLAQATALNDHATPVQIDPHFKRGDNGENQITPIAKPVGPKLLQEVYGRCSDLIHVGSLGRILDGKMPSYDLGQLECWVAGFRSLLVSHMLLLPGIQTVLVYLREGEKSQLIVMAGEGEAVFNTSELADFKFENQ